ncbi:hypothetical protein DPM19_32975 [Actinomadura craniellae]|uniref:Extracellular solute-binding protein n=1 Tax=Actinomadura craniellae TaxID=2231787 RepID=A0A365GVU9_9ACTN|nr:hypothetical protein [Actinomadura craniellae]RAY10947.1 hypothetical protein DPM19_32975 [Actinomadura craniellae]
MKRVLSLILATGLAIGVIIAIVLGRGASDTVTVRGVIGSEKLPFFADPAVRDAFARHGLRVEVDPAGSRQIATTVNLDNYAFAFPGGAPAAEQILRRHGRTAKYAPFSTPMAIASFQPIVDVLAGAGVARRGAGGIWIFDVRRYLELVEKGTRWDQIRGNTAYPVRKNVLVSTTDVRDSNSAAMYLSLVSHVANGDAIVQGAEAERRVLPLLSRLFLDQGYSENSSEGPFEDYLAVGMGKTPLVCIYEAQFVGRAVTGQIRPGMVLMYPSPTVVSKHTLVPLNSGGDRVGRLLTSDPALQQAAARHGLRTADAARFAKVVAENRVPVTADLVDVVDTPSYGTLENLVRGIEQGYGPP